MDRGRSAEGLPASAESETFGGVTYQIGGELVPVLTIDISQTAVHLQHHDLLWKHTRLAISLRNMRGSLKRMMAGMQVFVTKARGPA